MNNIKIFLIAVFSFVIGVTYGLNKYFDELL